MQIHNLKPKTRRHRRKIVGRGGKRGKTSGKGGKGQTARAGHRIRPEVRDLIKKLPKLRGYRTPQIKPSARVVNLGELETRFSDGQTVSPRTLHLPPPVKILGEGELTKKLSIEGCRLSASARRKIEQAGGTVS